MNQHFRKGLSDSSWTKIPSFIWCGQPFIFQTCIQSKTARSIPRAYQQEALALPRTRHVNSNSNAQAGLSTMTAVAFASLVAQEAVHDALSQSAFFKHVHTQSPYKHLRVRY